MAHDWLLVETLGNEPAVVAQGRHPTEPVPIGTFLRRSPRLATIRTAIAESVQAGQGFASITPKGSRVIRTEPVMMSDGRVHGVHVWSGPADADPPERPLPGALTFDLTLGVATDTPQSLANWGNDSETDGAPVGVFTEDLPIGDLSPSESKALAVAVTAEPGQTVCTAWDAIDWQGNPITAAFVARKALERGADGLGHVVSRGMNWRVDLEGPAEPPACARTEPDWPNHELH